MMALVVLKLATAILSVGLASGILARDHELAANRLLSTFLFCNAYWAGSEFFLYRSDDPELALGLYRAMCLGWMPMGVLCMQATLDLSAMDDHPIARSSRIFYAAIGLMLPIALATGFVIADAEPTPLGWRPIFGPGFPIAYCLLVAPIVGTLMCWRGMMFQSGSGGRRPVARIVFFGLSGAWVAGTMTAVVLPLLGIPSVGFTTTVVALVGLMVALTLKRYGHSLISPEAFAREMFDTLDDGVVLVGEDGVVRDANRAFLRLVETSETDAIGRRITDWVPGFFEASAWTESAILMDLETHLGEKIPVLVSSPVPCHGAGRQIGQVYVLRDRREVVSLQRRLVVSARLAAVGDLSKSISHSIEEPVESTHRELESLSEDWHGLLCATEGATLDPDCDEAIGEGLELIAECVEGVGRIASIVQKVGRFSSDRTREALELHSLSEIVEHSLRIASVRASDAISIESNLDPEVKVLCHRSQLERVVTNLLVNAIHALGGESEGPAHLTVGVAGQGDRALVHVEDNGCGIDAEVIDRIFDPFFTTKPVGEGTGLGLAISYHIVKDHGGEIRVSSIAGRGTSMTVALPRSGEAR
jgi:signal transduction histidine kinase